MSSVLINRRRYIDILRLKGRTYGGETWYIYSIGVPHRFGKKKNKTAKQPPSDKTPVMKNYKSLRKVGFCKYGHIIIARIIFLIYFTYFLFLFNHLLKCFLFLCSNIVVLCARDCACLRFVYLQYFSKLLELKFLMQYIHHFLHSNSIRTVYILIFLNKNCCVYIFI